MARSKILNGLIGFTFLAITQTAVAGIYECQSTVPGMEKAYMISLKESGGTVYEMDDRGSYEPLLGYSVEAKQQVIESENQFGLVVIATPQAPVIDWQRENNEGRCHLIGKPKFSFVIDSKMGYTQKSQLFIRPTIYTQPEVLCRDIPRLVIPAPISLNCKER